MRDGSEDVFDGLNHLVDNDFTDLEFAMIAVGSVAGSLGLSFFDERGIFAGFGGRGAL